MRFFFLLLCAGCGAATGTACGDGAEVCALVGLDTCTVELGDRAPHAFCTTRCDGGGECGVGARCAPVPWLRDRTAVCVPSEWLDLWHE